MTSNNIDGTYMTAKQARLKLRKARKAWMRNRPCPCNSGKKFKKCCWSAKQQELKKLEIKNGL